MHAHVCKSSVALVVALLSGAWASTGMEQWEGHFYPSAEIEQTFDMSDHTEYETTALTADEEGTQPVYRDQDAEDEMNATTSGEELLSLGSKADQDPIVPSLYAPQAKMYIKDDATLLHSRQQHQEEDKTAPQEVEEPRVINRFSLKRLTGSSAIPTYEKEDHNSVYHNHHQMASQTPPAEEEMSVTEAAEEVTTQLTTTTTTHKPPKRIAADAKSLGYLIKDLYLRTPLAALVDTHPAALKQSRALWENAVSPNSTLSIVLVPFNSTGVGEIAYARGGRGFRAALRSVKSSAAAHGGGAFSENGGGAVFYGVLRAAQLVPYDSAIFLCTDRPPGDPDLAQLAATTLIRKRIRLYALWFGPAGDPATEDDEQMNESEQRDSTEALLAEAALRSGGEWIVVRGEPAASAQMSSEEDAFADQPEADIVTLAVRKHLHGQQAVSLVVDASVTSLQIEIQGSFKEALLQTSNDATIDLLNSTSVATFSGDSRVVKSTRTELSARIGVPAGQDNGDWVLLTNQEPNAGEYNLTVRADSGIGFEAAVQRDDGDTDPVLRLRIHGPLDTIGGVSIVDSTGREITNLPYTPTNDSPSKRSELKNSEIVLPAEKVPESDFYVRLMGKDDKGEDITRLSYVTQSQVQLAPPTLIELGENSQLLLNSGARGQVHFEVTNQRIEPVFYHFSVHDEMGFLSNIHPDRAWLAGGQTINVVLYMHVPPGTAIGATDQLTFRAESQRGGQATKTAALQVSEYGNAQDATRPYLTYKWVSRCEGKLGPQYCSGAIWALEVTAQDYESGLLRLSSVPRGLAVRGSSYAAGSKEPVTAYYSASCCNPRVVITAVDVAGNQYSYTVDASDIYLDGASISLIVVGILLLIALIVILVLGIRAITRSRSASRDLPAYRSERARI